MPITLGEAKARFQGPYAPNEGALISNLNLVIERFFSQGNWKGLRRVARYPIYPYEDNGLAFKQFTLGREMQAVKGARFDLETGGQTRNVLPLYWWWQWTHAYWTDCSCRHEFPNAVQDLGEGYTTFRDWTVDSQLRIRTDDPQTGTINLRGLDESNLPINAGKGEDLDLSVDGDTTTATFKAYTQIQVVKPPTNGIVKLYAWDGTTETLVGYYYPGDKVISYRRYSIPNAVNYETVQVACTQKFVPLVYDNDVIWPDNIGALEAGLLGLHYERATQADLSSYYWNLAYQLLNGSLQQEHGNPIVQVPILHAGFDQVEAFF